MKVRILRVKEHCWESPQDGRYYCSEKMMNGYCFSKLSSGGYCPSF